MLTARETNTGPRPWMGRPHRLRSMFTSEPRSLKARQRGNEVAESGEYSRQNVAAKVFDGIYVRLPVHGASQNNSGEDRSSRRHRAAFRCANAGGNDG